MPKNCWYTTSMVFPNSCLKTKSATHDSETIILTIIVRKWNSLQWSCSTIHKNHKTLFARFICCHVQQVLELGQHKWTVSLAFSVIWSSWLRIFLKSSHTSDIVLIIDAMAIQKGTWWDPKKKCYTERVDYGTDLPEDEDDLGTEAMVFMICSITGHWKHPIAYFIQTFSITTNTVNQRWHWLIALRNSNCHCIGFWWCI